MHETCNWTEWNKSFTTSYSTIKEYLTSYLYNRNDYTMVALENLVLILIRQELKLKQIIYRSDFNTMAWNHTVWEKIYYMKKISWLNWQWPNHYVLRGLKIFLSSHMRKIYIITTEIMSGFQKYLHTNSLLLLLL